MGDHAAPAAAKAGHRPQKGKPRPIDFYRPLPFCRPKGKGTNDFKYVMTTAAGRTIVTVSREKLEARRRRPANPPFETLG